MRYLMYVCDHCGCTEVDWNQDATPPLIVVHCCAVCQALRTMLLVGEGDSIPPEVPVSFDMSTVNIHFNNLTTEEKSL